MEESLSQKYEPLFNKTALIDGDIIVHRSAAIAEPVDYLVSLPDPRMFDSYKDAKECLKAYHRDEDALWTRKRDLGLDFALAAARNTVTAILDHAKPKDFKLFLSGRNNFRYETAKTVPYKGSREIHAKPKHYRKVREMLVNEYGAITTDGYEADDAIGMESTSLGRSSFICTIDKDLDQLSGWHYDWVKDRVYRVSRKEADFNLYAQVLSGDSTDDVPGLKGIGPVKAGKILDGATGSDDLLRRVWDQYRTSDSGGNTEAERWNYFVEQLRLVYILRTEADLKDKTNMKYEEVFKWQKESRSNSDQEPKLESQGGSPNTELNGTSSRTQSTTPPL